MTALLRSLFCWTMLSSTLRWSSHQIRSCATAAAMGVLDPVEQTMQNVQRAFGTDFDIHALPPQHREPVSITHNLCKRLRNVGCRNCWVRRAHCICEKLQPMEILPFQKIFVLMHHKEVGLALDTAKLIFATFPETSRLVVGGIPAKFQDSMQEMQDALQQGSCVVLFPKEGAPLASTVFSEGCDSTSFAKFPNLVVLDGTWEQARRLHSRYIRDDAQHVQLNPENKLDDEGRQLRRHPIPLREIATVHALQLLAEDLGVSLPLREYQILAKEAAMANLGPRRLPLSEAERGNI